MTKKTSLEDACILSAIKLARFFVRTLPEETSFGAARLIGRGVSKLTKRSRIAYKNLRMVYDGQKDPADLRRLATASIENLAVSAVEMLRIPDMTEKDVREKFTIVGEEHVRPYLEARKGVIFLTGHYGSWELLNIVSAIKGWPLLALARVQKHPRSDRYLNDLRRSKGSLVVHKGMPVREMLRALKEGKIIGVLSDQDGGKKGRWVDFMGRRSSIPPGVAAFSLRTGCPIFPVFITRLEGGRHRIEVEPPLSAPPEGLDADAAEAHLLQQYSGRLERIIRRAPEQWLWAHRRWKSSPDRKVLLLSDAKAGHLNQSLAVLDAIRRQRQAHGVDPKRVRSEVTEVRFRSPGHERVYRLLHTITRGHMPYRAFWASWALSPDTFRGLSRAYADVVISCGSSLLGVNLWLKSENAAKSVVVMKPSLPFSHFDAVIAPRHDDLESHESLFCTEGALSALTPEDLEVEGAALASEFGLADDKPVLGLLIGGDTAKIHFEPEGFTSLMRAAEAFCREREWTALGTSSRRTAPWAEARLKEIFSDRRLCPMMIIANEANRSRTVPGILGLCDAVLVTAESMSMVSEALTCGKPVIVLKAWDTDTQKKKYNVFLERLVKRGLVALVDGERSLRQELERAAAGKWADGRTHRLVQEAVLAGAVKKVMGS